VRLDRAALSEAGQGTAAERTGADGANLFLAAVVQLGGPGSGRGIDDSMTLRQFAGIDVGAELVPDETTICKFRPPRQTWSAGCCETGLQSPRRGRKRHFLSTDLETILIQSLPSLVYSRRKKIRRGPGRPRRDSELQRLLEVIDLHGGLHAGARLLPRFHRDHLIFVFLPVAVCQPQEEARVFDPVAHFLTHRQ
jgi:hypothetical protein